jgi:hypothetical protein
MTSKLTELAIDCADPNGLARFWCSVLDYEVQDEDDGIVTIGSPMVPEGKNHLGPVPPTLTFARVPEGKTVKNSLHLDVNPTDREQYEEVRRLLDLGARHADVGQTGDESWSYLPTQRGTSSASLRAAAPDRRPHTAPGLLPVACPRSREHHAVPRAPAAANGVSPTCMNSGCWVSGQLCAVLAYLFVVQLTWQHSVVSLPRILKGACRIGAREGISSAMGVSAPASTVSARPRPPCTASDCGELRGGEA